MSNTDASQQTHDHKRRFTPGPRIRTLITFQSHFTLLEDPTTFCQGEKVSNVNFIVCLLNLTMANDTC